MRAVCLAWRARCRTLMTKGHFLVAFGSVGRPVMEMGKVGGWLRAALGSQGIASVKASRNFALGGRGLLLEQEPAESAATARYRRCPFHTAHYPLIFPPDGLLPYWPPPPLTFPADGAPAPP
jgi:hypothetical protein